MRRRSRFTLLLYVGATAAVLALGVFYLVLSPAQLDPKTACPKAGPESSTVVIVDTSDPLASHQQTALNRLAKFLTDSQTAHDIHVPPGHILSIYEIGSPEPKRLFHRCNPGDPATRDWRGKLNLSQGEVLPRLHWEKFTGTLAEAFPDVTRSAPQTPLIETIRFVRHAEFPPASVLRGGDVHAGRIVIISDMLQHTDQLSHFGAHLPSAVDAVKDYGLDLRGIDIHLRYLRVDRYRPYQGARHFTWWRKFFVAAGSQLRHTPEVW